MMPSSRERLLRLLLAGPQFMSFLSEKLNCSQSNVTTLADTLERHEFVKRKRDDDRRRVSLAITDKGRESLTTNTP